MRVFSGPRRRLLTLCFAIGCPAAFADSVSLTELPAPDGYPVAGVSNIAADGTVIGVVYPDGLVVRWRPGADPEVLGGGITFTLDNILPLISKDGSAIVASGYFPGDGDGDALVAAPELWSGATDWARISGITLGSSSPFGVSYDGRTLVGSGEPAVPPAEGPTPQLPWIWNEAGGQVELALPDEVFSGQAWAVSNDGSVAAGFVELTADDAARYGMRWVAGVPTWITDADGLRVGQAIGCNSDCSVIVGAGVTGDVGSKQAWRWSEAAGVQYLDPPADAGADAVVYAFESNEDGTVIVGSYVVFDPTLGPTNHGFLWTAADGMRDISQYLADYGIEFGGADWVDLLVDAVTPDGKTLLLNGLDADYTRRRAVVQIAVDDWIFADGFEPIGPL